MEELAALLLYWCTLGHLCTCASIWAHLTQHEGALCLVLLSRTLHPGPLENRRWLSESQDSLRGPGTSQEPQGCGLDQTLAAPGLVPPAELHREVVLLARRGQGCRNPRTTLIKHNFMPRRPECVSKKEAMAESWHTPGGSPCLSTMQGKRPC